MISRNQENPMKHIRFKKDIAYYVKAHKWKRLGHRDDPATWEMYRALMSGSQNPTVTELARLWWAWWCKLDRSPKTKQGYEQMLKETSPVMAVFGRMRPDDIEPSMIRVYLDESSAKIRANREITMLSQILKWGRERGYMRQANPCDGVSRNPKGKKREYLDDATFWAVYEAATPSVRCAMSIAYMTGLRLSDVLRLRHADVRDGHLHSVEGKVRQAVRFVVTPELKEAISLSPLDIGPIVANADGGHFAVDVFERHWRRAKRGHDVTFHDLRRKNASDRFEAGEDASLGLGHSSAMTSRYINHPLGRIVTPLGWPGEKGERMEKVRKSDA